jgi:hypothetical protein
LNVLWTREEWHEFGLRTIACSYGHAFASIAYPLSPFEYATRNRREKLLERWAAEAENTVWRIANDFPAYIADYPRIIDLGQKIAEGDGVQWVRYRGVAIAIRGFRKKRVVEVFSLVRRRSAQTLLVDFRDESQVDILSVAMNDEFSHSILNVAWVDDHRQQ